MLDVVQTRELHGDGMTVSPQYGNCGGMAVMGLDFDRHRANSGDGDSIHGFKAEKQHNGVIAGIKR